MAPDRVGYMTVLAYGITWLVFRFGHAAGLSDYAQQIIALAIVAAAAAFLVIGKSADADRRSRRIAQTVPNRKSIPGRAPEANGSVSEHPLSSRHILSLKPEIGTNQYHIRQRSIIRTPMTTTGRQPDNRHLLPFLLLCAILAPLGSPAQGQEQTTLGGYGELHYNEPDGSRRGELDFHRFVIYYAHSFSDAVSFQSEVELEHTRIEAGEDAGGELAIEQAYLDWRFAGSTGLRAGLVLIPMGIINERHEPATFNGVERPNVDKTIIPSTWREAGLGLYGRLSEAISFQAYVVAGLKADGFSGSGGIRGGRQSGFRSDPSNPSFTGRIDYAAGPSFRLGASAFAGNTTGGVSSLGSGTLMLVSGDGEFTEGLFRLRAVGVYGTIATPQDQRRTAIRRSSRSPTASTDYAEAPTTSSPHRPARPPAASFYPLKKYNTQASVTVQANRDDGRKSVGATLKPTYNGFRWITSSSTAPASTPKRWWHRLPVQLICGS